ncbi:MAG: tRNA dihydrouridine synthase DusB [Gammaproteobacteria bacterium CG22_combo_CG10-13_8_21_14_all_40_8]|nr:MAG: tRNA dihydrouridine synthase DusB [Gammaproteobacteria bacterium CG22_combo_CG10-13_8_21_14_all_40_8]
MQIGPYILVNPTILAPMAGVTDLPFRKLCKKFGAAMAISEMLTSDHKLWHTQKSQKRMDHSDEPGVRWIQIAGSDPLQMAQAAKFNQEQGAQIIDINMGCPAKKVCNKAAGSALLAHPQLVRNILRAVIDATKVPITLKIRTGSDVENRNALDIAQIAEQEGISALSIHGRTRACRFNGYAEYETIRLVKQQTNIPIIANGDITSGMIAKQVLQSTQADALMIGRAAQGNPWIFNEINHYLTTGEQLASLKQEKVAEVLLQHISELHQFYGEYLGIRVARKHVGWYLSNHFQEKALKTTFNQINDKMNQLKFIQKIFADSPLAQAS